MILALLNWFNGWRRDLDGWLVRARRATDPTSLPCNLGFVEEACIAVRSDRIARSIDTTVSAPRREVAA